MAAALYDPRFEHEACGLGAIARLDGRASHEVVEQALGALANLAHRGATGADPDTGDGAGIMTQLPDRFLRGLARSELGHDLPEPGCYATGIVFLPRDATLRQRCEELCVRICAEEGHRALGWRDMPVRGDRIGPVARACEPVVRQLFVERRSGDAAAFERKLYVIRRRVERAAAAAGVPEAEFTIVSLSARRLVYKGLLTAPQLAEYYEDLADPAFESALALVHSRFSTNTFGTWDLAHPFNLLAHNGEINTVRGNGNWLTAREPQLRSQLLGDDLPKLYPIAEERWSDSAKLDAAIELLVMGGRSLAHALSMLVPPAQAESGGDDRVRAFHEYHAALAEPWDGPAAIVATDGVRVVAGLDRNGLRPLRFVRSRDGLVIVSSEVGVVEIDARDIAEAGRIAPGQLLVADSETGAVSGDREVKRALARRRPYRAWLDGHRIALDELAGTEAAPRPAVGRDRLLTAFGYTAEELELIVDVLAREGTEPVGSMGDDAAAAVLSARPRLLSAFFRQQFAQVTNPPIDPQREALVMSLATSVGPIGNLLDERPEDCRGVICTRPVLTAEEAGRLRGAPGLETVTLEARYRVADGPEGLERAIDRLCAEASRAAWDGAGIVILSDRGVGSEHAPVPALLATAAVHSHLVREGARTMCGLVVESGEPRETMHVALLIGYGAAAVCPYLALETLDEPLRAPFVEALSRGLLKACSKMGISTVQSYRGAQIFEAVGLGPGLIGRYFPGTVSRIGGVELADLHADVAERHAAAFPADGEAPGAMEVGGDYRYRAGGERHVWAPGAIVSLQRSVRDADPAAYEAFRSEVADASLRGLLDLAPAGPPLADAGVEPAAEIVKRFATGAMSLGAISPEAHETLAIAMNRLGGRSNSGEGGEDLARSIADPNGDLRRSAIKQVASGRFGVTAAYLVDADQLQIKIAQGAKPGEGGQLPGSKVDARIAELRHSLPGVGLISPPPHHDVYSIEDLAQLVHDLKCVSPGAEISVKLVAEAGVGTIAAGVAKAKAEHIVIAGHDGGTGAAPLGSIKHAGLPWELGLAEAHQVLVRNGLRGRVRLQVDGGLRTGRDVVVAAALGADEFGFSTAPLVAAGCVMMRVCHLNTCPVGIATQDPELRRRFAGTPEDVVRYFLLVAGEVRELLAELGVATLADAIGRGDLLRQRERARERRAGIDLTSVIATSPDPGRGPAPRPQDHGLDATLDARLIDAAAGAIEAGEPVAFDHDARNTDRSIGAQLAGEIARRAGPAGLPDGSVILRLRGCAGQSLAAFAPAGLTIDLTGACNDYAGKGLSGGRLIVRPAPDAGFIPERNVIAGNTVLYGATSGEAFFRGRAGERFAVRNSGAKAVVEGVGDHGCEYMTGGVVVVLGPTGRNFAAGMSGGIAFVLDEGGMLADRCNTDTVALVPLTEEDTDVLWSLLGRHLEHTGSDVASRLFAARPAPVEWFVKVMPHDLRRALERDDRLLEAAGA
jgi:glutamate synthase domain-containing protein 2/glutamate synthase domain-containing protein 1/glutamate synthase domain-containing protein 3